MLKIIKAGNELIDESRIYCESHGAPSRYLMCIGSVMIPLCDDCIDELKKEQEKFA